MDIKERYKRQLKMFDPSEIETPLHIIGVGNIGSNVVLGCAKMGLRDISVYDFDDVEEHNLASQFYGIEDIGKPKTEALKKRIKELVGIDIKCYDKYEEGGLKGIVVFAVDSLDERLRILRTLQPFPDILIDGRMGGGDIEVYTYKDRRDYLNTIRDIEASPIPCGERYISYTSLIMGGLITNQIKRFLNNEKLKRNIIFNTDEVLSLV